MNKDEIIFDQYSRYQACADLMLQAGIDETGTILDIGCGPEMLFRDFLPDSKMSFVDPLIPEGTLGTITGNIFSSTLEDKKFDAVCSVDVLEHVPPEVRERFIQKMSSLATDYVVLGFPTSDSSDAAEVDSAIEGLYKTIHEKDYSWLEEHFRYGLPSLKETVEQLENLGWHCQAVGHGYAPWLEELLGFVINVWDLPDMKEVVLNVSERFNKELYRFDYGASCYRQFIIASRKKLPALSIPGEARDNKLAEKIFTELMDDARKQYFIASMKMLSEKGFEKFNDLILEKERLLKERDNAESERDEYIEITRYMRDSWTWRLTQPFRFLSRLCRYGLCEEDHLRLSKYVRSRYKRLPLPNRIRKYVSFTYHNVFGRVIRKFVRLLSKNLEFKAPAITLVEPSKGLPDYIIWGVVDWHFRHQRPQQLALALAEKGHRVFYISPIFLDDDRAGFKVDELGDTGALFQIKLYVNGAPLIYSSAAKQNDSTKIKRSMGEVLDWANIKHSVSLVQHPYWFDMARSLPDNRLVYDCMDHHEGFNNTGESLLQLEKLLLEKADLTVTTSTWLDNAVASCTQRRALIRNAGEYAHFSNVPKNIYRDLDGRRIIGYYGAIADWFDIDLIESVARKFSEYTILLVGEDTVNAQAKLCDIPNIQFIGEVVYEKLPEYLYSFDVCLLPFKVIPLTIATNPVKAYEYLSAGKPVVSVDLPEMHQFEGLIYIASDQHHFLETLENVLDKKDEDKLIQRRKEFAANQTWVHRVEELCEQVSKLPSFDPKVSIIVVTYNNLELTRACLASIENLTDYDNLEVIVVDNNSTDGSKEYLKTWVSNNSERKLLLNDDNRGFSAANNQGLKIATGDYLVLLNNDTYVTPGWVRTLVGHLKRDSSIGLIGPVTNNIGNEAKIDIHYNSMSAMLVESSAYTRRHIGQVYDLNVAAFFCVMITRKTYEQVGSLDEIFGIGFFEDDDYCRRINQLGLRIACAEDVFIHHNLSASFDKLKVSVRNELFEKNKKLYEEKWGLWAPHEPRKTK